MKLVHAQAIIYSWDHVQDMAIIRKYDRYTSLMISLSSG